MDNIILMENSSFIKTKAREKLAGRWKQLIVITCLAMLIIGSVSILTGMFFSEDSILESWIDTIYSILVGAPITLGLYFVFLKVVRDKNTEISDVFAGFERYVKVMGLYIFISIFIFLWTLLFIIPGVIAAIRYSMAYYILLEHPEYSIKECVDESKKMMSGNLGKYFVTIYLSMLGWILLTAAVVVAIYNLVESMILHSPVLLYTSMFIILLPLLFILVVIVISPLMVYIKTTEAVFYDMLKGNIKARVYIQRSEYINPNNDCQNSQEQTNENTYNVVPKETFVQEMDSDDSNEDDKGITEVHIESKENKVDENKVDENKEN